MKRNHLFVFSALSVFSISLLAGCNSSGPYDITFVNYDGTVLLELKEVEKGTEIEYSEKRPVRFDDASNYYVFNGWDKEITPAKKDVTYTAQYEAYPLTSVTEEPDEYVDALPREITGGNILHAFCWKYSDIESQLPFIRDAGYKAVQISPVQVPKSSGSSWWAFYQPLAFRIADHGESPLGDKDDLRNMCKKAEEYGIDIIADIVFNHMANIGDDKLEEDGTPKVSELVGNYEEYIYKHRNDATNPTFHHNKSATGSGAETQYYPYGALPDLNTGNKYVQGRALDLLKECIDVGIDGFRFDAAKHIETPDDPDYPSDFWPNTLGEAKKYYLQKTQKDLYAYGEILGLPKDRDIDVYTKWMNVTETSFNNGIETGAINRKAYNAVNNVRGLDVREPEMATTWIESHDSYIDSDNPLNNLFLARCWAILSAKQQTTNVFLARPDSHGSPSVGIIGDYFFRDEIIGAANRFHNRFIRGESYENADGSIYISEMVNGDDIGAMVVDLGLTGKTTVDFGKLGTGVYYDQLTGNSVTVRNGHATIDTGSEGIMILTKTKNLPRPSFSVDYRGGVIASDRNIVVDYKNADKVTYKYNNGTTLNLPDDKAIPVNKFNFDSDNKLKITITASNDQYTVTESFYYNYKELIPGYYNVVNIDPSRFTDYEIYMWSWKGDENGKWSKDYTVQNGTILVDVNTLGITGMVFGLFEKGYVISNVNAWDDNVKRQTTDISGSVLEQGYYDGSNF